MLKCLFLVQYLFLCAYCFVILINDNVRIYEQQIIKMNLWATRNERNEAL